MIVEKIDPVMVRMYNYPTFRAIKMLLQLTDDDTIACIVGIPPVQSILWDHDGYTTIVAFLHAEDRWQRCCAKWASKHQK